MNLVSSTCSLVAVALLAGPGAPLSAQDTTSIPVTVTEVRTETVAPSVPAAGTVFSRNEGQITAGFEGRLEWIAEPGDFVAMGEPVARFDCSLMRLQLEEQQAVAEREEINLATLTREADQQRRLFEAHTVSSTQYERTCADRDLAASTLAIARIRIRQTENELARCVGAAPFSGVITERFARAGQHVERNTVLGHMTDTTNLEVRASLPIRYLPRVQLGESVEVRSSGTQLTGTVRKIVPAAEAMSQTFQVRVDLPQHAHSLVAAGQLVSVNLPLLANASLTVPRDSIVLREEGTYVMRINGDNQAERVFVDVADAKGDRVAISGGLAVGDRIAVRGAEALDEGQAVSIQVDS